MIFKYLTEIQCMHLFLKKIVSLFGQKTGTYIIMVYFRLLYNMFFKIYIVSNDIHTWLFFTKHVNVTKMVLLINILHLMDKQKVCHGKIFDGK